MKKSTSRIIVIIAITAISLFSNSCYNDNGDAVVTIHLERNDLAAMGIYPKESIVDRIFHFFITRAEAAPTWNASRSNLTLTITSDSFEEKQFTIPSLDTSYKVTLPPESNATFTITSETDWGPSAANIQKNWGGHFTTKLTPGEQDITIQMLPMTIFQGFSPSAGLVTVSWWVPSSPTFTIISYKLYHSISSDGEYTLTGSPTGNSFTHSGIGTTHYYYRVSIVTDIGDGIYREGVMSDPQTW